MMIIRVAIAVAVLTIIASLLPSLPEGQVPSFPGEIPKNPTPSPDYVVTPLGEPPQILIQFVIVGLILAMVMLVAYTLWQWQSAPKSTEQLLKEAESAANALQSGADLKNVVLRCYIQMSQILQEEQGIRRQDHMTPKEFEVSLKQKGFPDTPVRLLTQLFEKVRYSQQFIDDQDEKLAMESLNAIIQHNWAAKD
ncbi:MAG: DUF4129 domain-containing protein [Anaerolineales bacterium]|nr:DUF4129 domain-containing protein [Chloroflexota bacterium]MBL6983389.1 DUF4129 domain-containing protein [Anaerolineales bacterium]